jgi:hypothetical protein
MGDLLVVRRFYGAPHSQQKAYGVSMRCSDVKVLTFQKTIALNGALGVGIDRRLLYDWVCHGHTPCSVCLHGPRRARRDGRVRGPAGAGCTSATDANTVKRSLSQLLSSRARPRTPSPSTRSASTSSRWIDSDPNGPDPEEDE